MYSVRTQQTQSHFQNILPDDSTPARREANPRHSMLHAAQDSFLDRITASSCFQVLWGGGWQLPPNETNRPVLPVEHDWDGRQMAKEKRLSMGLVVGANVFLHRQEYVPACCQSAGYSICN